MRTIFQLKNNEIAKILALFVLLFCSGEQVNGACNTNPNFNYIQNGNDVIFTALHTQGVFTRYYWSFDDNSTGFNKIESHTFQRAGNYNVKLFVSDSIGSYCDTFSSQIVIIVNSLPCNVVNETINDTLYLNDRINNNYYCLTNPLCFDLSYYRGLHNTTLGNIANGFSGCLSYSYNSTGIDTFTVFQCDTVLNICKSIFFNINVLPVNTCEIIVEDTIRLQLDTLFNGFYNLSVLYDSVNMVQYPFVLEEWSNTTGVLNPNRLFDSVAELYQYMDSVVNGIFEYNGSYVVYSTNTNAISYTSGNGLKIVIPSLLGSYQIPFIASSTYFATYCSSLEYGRYRFDNPTWNYISLCSPDNIAFNFNQTGVFSYNIYDTINHCEDKVVFVIENSTNTLCDTTTCLLPGDADHDFTVNNYDALAIGLSYNRTGVVRANATIQYTLQACDNWNTTHFYGYNDKFADCNGDGIINSNDALVIDRNYIAQAQNVFNHRQSQLDSLPSVTLTFDTLPTMVVNGNCNGAELVADINVGSANQPLVNGYGFAFSVNYPFDSDSCFSVTVDLDPNSWFQTNNPVLLFYKNIPQYKRVDVSVVRTDGLPRTGNGKIGRIKMITEGGIFRSSRLSANKIFDFSVSDVAAINQIGQRINLNGSSSTVNFVVAGVKQNKVDGLKIFPNPTNNKLFIHAKEDIASIKIIDLSGRIINEFLPDKNDVELDFSTTENGMYIIEIKGKNSVSYEKVFKQ